MNNSTQELRNVFISSTIDDLKEYRAETSNVIGKLGWLAIGSEDLVSRDDRPKDACLELVKKCHYYVGIFAHRYGHIPNGDKQSITEQEYKCAGENGIKCLIFIIDDNHPWKKCWIETGSLGAALEALKKKLKSRHTCSFFTTPDNLAMLVSVSLAQCMRNELTDQIKSFFRKSKPSTGKDESPTIQLRIFRHPKLANDVRCQIINKSDFPTSVKTYLSAKFNGSTLDSPVPGHYRGEETWNIPARDGFEGHFDMEEYILKPIGRNFQDFLGSKSNLEIKIRYSAQTLRGKWKDLGELNYYFDIGNRNWNIKL